CHARDELIDKVADLFCELNLLHPFREGNGRVLRFFFEEMLYTIGYDVTWPKNFSARLDSPCVVWGVVRVLAAFRLHHMNLKRTGR
ncbi:MAG: Fic family protein, partial [Shewanella sp.]